MNDTTGMDIGTQPAPTLDEFGKALRETATDDRSPLERLSPEERTTWDLKGELPAHITGKTAPGAKPADNDDAPAVDAKGAPITEGGKPISKREQRQRDTIQRAVNDGIRVEREAREKLEREIADLRRGAQPPPAAQPAAAKPDPDKEPTLDDFSDEPDPYIAYGRAYARWEVRQEFAQRDKAAQTRSQSDQQHEQVMTRVVAHTQRQEAIKTTVPDYDERTQAVREQLDLRSPLALAVVESDVSEHLVLHFADHPEDFQRIGALGMSNLPAALREIGKIEAAYSGTSSAPGAAKPSPKLVSSAPPPPPALGTRSADPTDASKAAVARSDYTAFAAAEDAKDLARMARR